MLHLILATLKRRLLEVQPTFEYYHAVENGLLDAC